MQRQQTRSYKKTYIGNMKNKCASVYSYFLRLPKAIFITNLTNSTIVYYVISQHSTNTNR